MTIQSVTPEEVERRRRVGEPVMLIDVRTPAEYATLHAEGAVSVPLDQLSLAALPEGDRRPIYVICQSGARGARACERLQAGGVTDVYNIAGGTSAWQQCGLPVVAGERGVISLERQVRIAAGSLVLLGEVLGWHVHAAFHAIAVFVGVGLVFAGITDWCGMALFLARMPWNRAAVQKPPGPANPL
jgi:rhodanese-related sulfurtransferase